VPVVPSESRICRLRFRRLATYSGNSRSGDCALAERRLWPFPVRQLGAAAISSSGHDFHCADRLLGTCAQLRPTIGPQFKCSLGQNVSFGAALHLRWSGTCPLSRTWPIGNNLRFGTRRRWPTAQRLYGCDCPLGLEHRIGSPISGGAHQSSIRPSSNGGNGAAGLAGS
jgi:hypothetical protein